MQKSQKRQKVAVGWIVAGRRNVRTTLAKARSNAHHEFMKHAAQSPTDPTFVQNPYPFYDQMRAEGEVFHWDDYDMPCAVSHAAVMAALKDRRMGREAPPEMAPSHAEHLTPFYDVEAHSMLELEPPRHTRLRGLVLRSFTSRRIAALEPEIDALARDLLADVPDGSFDLLTQFAQPLPAIVIARLLGVPDSAAPDLLRWSNAMVAMYQARRTRAVEDAAVAATQEFKAFLEDVLTEKRQKPADDLISALLAAEEDGDRLSKDELMTTVILLLNAGHEATVHTMGNGVKALLERDIRVITPGVVEEVMRFDPPLHMFTRWVYEDIDFFGHSLKRGQQIACLLGAANRDPAAFDDPNVFRPERTKPAHAAFGGGIHFCVGAPLARLELLVGLRVLFETFPNLALAEPPQYADVFHFHGLKSLRVTP